MESIKYFEIEKKRFAPMNSFKLYADPITPSERALCAVIDKLAARIDTLERKLASE